MVPKPMLKKVFFRHICKTATTATDMNSGRPWFPVIGVTDFRQYTTKVAIMAVGKTFPRYFTDFGTSFLPPNNRKGTARIANVMTPIISIADNRYILLFVMIEPPLVLTEFYFC